MEWHKTLTFSPDRIRALEAFIKEPDTRQSDIFDSGTFPIDDATRLDWIIKHDLFEGVVLHLSLMSGDGTQFLAGYEVPLSEVHELLTTHPIEHGQSHYQLIIHEG